MTKRTLRDLPDSALGEARVLIRVDYNVPLEDSEVADDRRIRATLPTLRYLLERDARIILMSHLGRPAGERRTELSLRPVARRLQELVETPVHFVADVTGGDACTAVDRLEPSEVLLLENTRFLPGEKRNDEEMSRQLAGFADVYVNDAFGAAHRAHASTAGVPTAVRREGRPAVAGLLMERELQFLGAALEAPEAPFVAILGGAKISGKIDVIENLLPRLDRLVIGGAMANTFFRALGLETGESLVEEDRVETAAELLERAGETLELPVDCVVETGAGETAGVRTLERDAVPPDGRIMDIGAASVRSFAAIIADAATVVWNGPMGVFEDDRFRQGTEGVARAVADATAKGATTIVGGGDTASAARLAGVADAVTHMSTGGGASLELLEGKTLPGVAALDDEDREDR